jgi:activator of 2-hydroxyglutaryl-CoA dehydratase/predicted nucleotide-binding protein (sugar kinase/HSP70/actin superfamily)
MNAPEYRLGLDLGSTAVKVVLERASTGELLWLDYQRHESRPIEKLAEMLRRAEAGWPIAAGGCHAFVTGSNGTVVVEPLGARYVQEVTALALAVERHEPQAGSVIELGGQDAKILLFQEEAGRRRTIVSMNDKCAGGTGAVIDKLSAKLKIPAGTVGDLPYAGLKVYPVAGKCGVFAETDINGLQKRGVPSDELMASLFDAIVLQNLTVLARGHTLRPRVLLLGGPNAFIRGLREAWQAHIARLWIERGVSLPDGVFPADAILAPPHAALFGAIGAIEFGRREAEAHVAYRGAAALGTVTADASRGDTRRGAPGVGFSGMDLGEFRARYELPPWTPPPVAPGSVVRGFIGLDAGSTSTKAVLLDEDGEVLAKAYQLSRGNPIEDAIDMFGALRRQIESQEARLEVGGVVTTGYAKDVLKDVFSADAALVETVAHAQSALQRYRDPHVIVDVGGQDIKIIVMRDGRVKDFRLNTQCSAGNGYFLQAIARSFGCPVEEFAEAAFAAREMPVFSYGCVLFLQSELSNVQRQGWAPGEVLAGLAAVLPANVFLYVAKAPNLARLGTRFVLQGGTQRNLAAVKAQVDFIRDSFRGQEREPEIALHPHAGEAGAIGAGLEAARLWREGHRTTFIGLDRAERIQFSTRCDEETRCHFCTNDCLRTFIDVWCDGDGAAPGDGLVAGDAGGNGHGTRDARRLVIASCEKGAVEELGRMREIKAGVDAVKARTPNLVAFAAREVFRRREVEAVAAPPARRAWSRAARAARDLSANRGRLRVGVPRVFNMYAFAPLFAGYLQSLGVPGTHLVYSDFTSTELYRAGSSRGSIDPCFPSKVALAHVHNLLQVKQARAPLSCIFFPMIDVLPARIVAARASNACPTVALTPQTVRAALTTESDVFEELGVRYLAPLLNLENAPLFARQMYETWHPLLGLSWEEHERAIAAGWAAHAAYEAAVRRRAREALDAIEREDRVGVVLLGRPYHHDPGLNHGIAEELQKLGYPVFSQSTLPLDDDLLDRLFGEEVRSGVIRHVMDISDVWKNSISASSNGKLWAAKFAARHPNLAALELSNFKCGHDAPIYSTIEEIIESSGTPYFAFKDLDENRPSSSIKLRLETLDYSLRRYREHLVRRRELASRVARWREEYERRLRDRWSAGVEAPSPTELTTG